jgi:hypothetical protein
VGLSPAQQAFVAAVISAAPVAAAVLLWTRWRRTGAVLLSGSMAGSLAFGVFYHFVEVSPDHVSEVSAGGWGTVFRATALLLALTEALGCWAGAWALSRRAWRDGEPALVP